MHTTEGKQLVLRAKAALQATAIQYTLTRMKAQAGGPEHLNHGVRKPPKRDVNPMQLGSPVRIVQLIDRLSAAQKCMYAILSRQRRLRRRRAVPSRFGPGSVSRPAADAVKAERLVHWLLLCNANQWLTASNWLPFSRMCTRKCL